MISTPDNTSELRTIAVVAMLAIGATIGAGGVSTVAAQSDENEYSVVQGGECVPIEPLGHGHQTVEEFYDYRTPETDPSASTYSSYGTAHLQEDDTSILFLHEGQNGISLVVVHDRVGGNTSGGSVTMQFTDLPQDGEWVVEDDNYSNETDDTFDHRGTSSRISWTWSEGRSDGAAFSGGLDDEFAVEIYPEFNEEADLQVYDGEVNDWQVISGPQHDRNRTSLAMDRPVTIQSGGCGSDTDESAMPGFGIATAGLAAILAVVIALHRR